MAHLKHPMGALYQFRVVIEDAFDLQQQFDYAAFANRQTRMLCRIFPYLIGENVHRNFLFRNHSAAVRNKAAHLARFAQFADIYGAERSYVYNKDILVPLLNT